MDGEQMVNKKKKKIRWWQILLIVVAVIVVLAVIAAAGVYMYLRHLVGKSYETDIPIVTRDEPYTINESELVDPPHIIETLDEPGTDDPDVTIPSPVTEPEETETDTDVTTDNPETDPPQTTTPVTTVKKPTVPVEHAGEYVGKIPIYKVDRKSSEIENILFVGRDEGSYYGRADSSMIISYNYTNNKLKIVSLLRDSYVPIEGHNWNKLGHALAYGGMGLYINTVNYVLDMDIQKYVVVDFAGIVKIVDAVGGVDIEFSKAEAEFYTKRWGSANVGMNHLNGTKALQFARNRSLAGTDFARAERQRKVLLAVFDKLKAMPANRAVKTVETMLQYVKTNIPSKEILDLAFSVFTKGGTNGISTTQMPFKGTWDYAYVKPPGYTGNMAVTKIDISANRKALYDYLYNGG